MASQASDRKPLYRLHPTKDVDGYNFLADLALDMRTSWDHSGDHIWEQLDPALWDLTRNPWVVLQTVSREKLQSVFADSKFSKDVAELARERHEAAAAPGWF